MFSRHGLKSLLIKFWNAVRPATQRKYIEQLERKVDDALEKNTREIQKNNQRKEKRLQKQLDAALKRQVRLERERRRQDGKFKKLRKEQELSSRLLTPEEKLSLLGRVDTEPLSEQQRNEISQKLKGDRDERIRRKAVEETR